MEYTKCKVPICLQSCNGVKSKNKQSLQRCSEVNCDSQFYTKSSRF